MISPDLSSYGNGETPVPLEMLYPCIDIPVPLLHTEAWRKTYAYSQRLNFGIDASVGTIYRPYVPYHLAQEAPENPYVQLEKIFTNQFDGYVIVGYDSRKAALCIKMQMNLMDYVQFPDTVFEEVWFVVSETSSIPAEMGPPAFDTKSNDSRFDRWHRHFLWRVEYSDLEGLGINQTRSVNFTHIDSRELGLLFSVQGIINATFNKLGHKSAPELIAQLAKLYTSRGYPFTPNDYEILSRQFVNFYNAGKNHNHILDWQDLSASMLAFPLWYEGRHRHIK